MFFYGQEIGVGHVSGTRDARRSGMLGETAAAAVVVGSDPAESNLRELAPPALGAQTSIDTVSLEDASENECVPVPLTPDGGSPWSNMTSSTAALFRSVYKFCLTGQGLN